MIIREAILRGAGVEFVLTNRETAGDRVESWLIDVAGWYGGVGVVDGGSQRRLGHGFFPAPSLRTGRELTLSGTLVFQSEADRSIADRFVSGLLWDGEFGELQVTTDDLTLFSQVKLGGEIKHAYLGTSAMEVQIPLTAPDPFLYAPARIYQIHPVGAGQGLTYPLFAQKSAPTKALAQEKKVFTAGHTGSKIMDTPITPGKSYHLKTVVTSDKTGMDFSITNKMLSVHETLPPGASTISSLTTIFENGFTAPLGASTALISAWGNRASGAIKDASYTVEMTLSEASPALYWGAGTPTGGAFANGGNADAHPIYTVHGSWPAGFRITTGSGVIEYPSPVHPSTPVRIDNRTGEVMVAGVDQTYRLTKRDWVTVPAGSAIQPRIEALAPSTGWLDVEIKDTYM